MKELSNLVLSLLCITFIPGILMGTIWYLVSKKGWSLRIFLALGTTIILAGFSILFWLSTGELWMLLGGIGISVIQGVIIFTGQKSRRMLSRNSTFGNNLRTT